MSDIQFCKRCLYATTHPFGLIIDNEGICSGCRIHEEKDNLDWSARWSLLENLVKPYLNKNGGNYDCIIPVTGEQDSYYIVYLAKVKLGLNPLLVSYNKYFNTPLGIHNLANLRIRFNCDIVYQNINPNSNLEEIINYFEEKDEEKNWKKFYDEEEYYKYPKIIKKYIDAGKIKGVENIKLINE